MTSHIPTPHHMRSQREEKNDDAFADVRSAAYLAMESRVMSHVTHQDGLTKVFLVALVGGSAHPAPPDTLPAFCSIATS
jgi:hypothetical protein